MHLPTRDHPAGSVVNEIAAGFMLRGRLVRPARVVVAAAPAPERE
jgi:molecular chaperone GrpE (heat shock protein)